MEAIFLSNNSFSVTTDKTTEFISGRRLKMDCGIDGLKYASIISSSFSTVTTVVIDEETLTSNLSEVFYSIIKPGTEGNLAKHYHSNAEGDGGYLPSPPQSFLDLSDTPDTYEDNKFLKTSPSGIVFTDQAGVTTFLDLIDTPSTYSGTTGRILSSTGSGIDFMEASVEYTGKWFFDSGAPTVNTPDSVVSAIPNDLYFNEDNGDVYKRNSSSINTLLSDSFGGTSLDTTKWSTNIMANASVTVNDQLELNNITGDAHSGAACFTNEAFAIIAGTVYELSFKWKPHKNHYASALAPGVAIYSKYAGRDTTNYGVVHNQYFKLWLGATNNTVDRTELRLSEQGTTVNTLGTSVAFVSIAIDETIWHDVRMRFNFSSRVFEVALDNSLYSFTGTVSQSVIDVLAGEFKLGFETADYNKTNSELFKDVILTYTSNYVWAPMSNFWPPDNHFSFLDLNDTPSSYIEGQYLVTTSSGINAIDGIILKASDNSRWRIRVTTSGVLYTEAL